MILFRRPARIVLLVAAAGVLAGWSTAAHAQGSGPVPLDSLRAQAAAAWADDRPVDALRLYQLLVTRDSAPEPMIRLATLLARAGQLPQSVAMYRRYTTRFPNDLDARVALARTLAWATRYDAAIAVYDSVLIEAPAFGPAMLGAAQTLAWAGRFDAAISRYRGWLTDNPGDTEARLALARTYSWAGRLRESEALYREAAAAAGGNREAERGLARVTAWRGDLASSERQWRALAASDTADLETLVGLAQVLRWRGRPAEAEWALRRALAVDPDYGDARSQLPWVLAELRASVAPVVDLLSDSDHNRVQTYTMSGSWPHVVTGVSVRGALTQRHASIGNDGPAGRASSTGARVGATWRRPGSATFVDASGGVSRLAGDTVTGAVRSRATRFAPAFALTAGGRPSRALGMSLTVMRVPFDETAPLIARGIGTEALVAEADVALSSRLAATATAEAARVTGGSVGNTRQGVAGSLRWTSHRRLSFAVSARTFGYDTTVSDGYFSPRAYRMAEASTRILAGRELGWSGLLDGGLGAQYLDFRGSESTRMVQRLRATVTYRRAPGREVFLTGGYANVAAPGQLERGEYRAVTLTAGGRLRL